MAIKVAGVACLTDYQDVQAELDKFGYLWDFVWSPGQSALHYGHQAPPVAWWRAASVSAPLHARRCRPPRWLLNSIWIPSGASRYGIGLFLATGAATAEILEAAGSDGSVSVEVKLTGSVLNEDEAEFDAVGPDVGWYLLPPVSLNNATYSSDRKPFDEGVGEEDLFIVPVVDARFLWQFRAITRADRSAIWTWTVAQTAVDDALSGLPGIDWGDNVLSGYRPDPFTLGQAGASAGLFADAICAATGRRIRMKSDGTFAADSISESLAADVARGQQQRNKFDAPLTLLGQDVMAQIIGGDRGFGDSFKTAIPPATVKVLFDACQGGFRDNAGQQREYEVDVTTDNADIPNELFEGRMFSDTEITVHTTAQADYSSDPAGAVAFAPDNDAACLALAKTIAQQVVAWGLEQWDFCAVPNWDYIAPSSRDDWWWLVIDRPVGKIADALRDPCEPADADPFTGPELVSFVRCKSIGWHDVAALEWAVSFTASDSPPARLAVGLCRVTLTSALARNGEATANIREYDRDTNDWENDTAYEVTVFDSLGRFFGEVGDKFWAAALPEDSSRFEIVGPVTDAFLAYAFLTTDLCQDTAEIGIENAKRYPDCEPITIPRVSNPFEHRGKAGLRVLLIRRDCPDSSSGSSGAAGATWEIIDIEKRTACAVMKVEDRGTCLTSAHHKFAAEWSPDHDPTEVCVITTIGPCEESNSSGSGSGSGSSGAGCDLAWTTIDWACCGTFVECSGSGSGSGSGA